MYRVVLCFALVSKLQAGSGLASCPTTPWTLNVFALKDIGSQAQPYQSDFEGSAAAVGDVHYKAFSLNVNGQGKEPYPVTTAQYAGGHLRMNGGRIAFSGIEVQGNVHLQNGASIAGNALVGGNVSGSGPSAGSIQGNLFIEGDYSPAVSAGNVTTQPFQPTLNLQNLATYFTELSAALSTIPAAVPYSTQYGLLSVDATHVSGTSAVQIPASVFATVWGIEINATAGASVVININDPVVQLQSLIWTFHNIRPSQVVLNMFNAKTLDIQGGPHQTTLLAPNAVTTFSQGLITGNVVVQSLLGGGQVNFPSQLNAIRCVPQSATQQSTTQQSAIQQSATQQSVTQESVTQLSVTQLSAPQQSVPVAIPQQAAPQQAALVLSSQAVAQQGSPIDQQSSTTIPGQANLPLDLTSGATAAGVRTQ